MKPKRIQRKRVKGWKMPEGAVYVGRPGRWGNPFQVGQFVAFNIGNFLYLRCYEKSHAGPEYKELKSLQDCIDAYRKYMESSPKRRDALKLRGKDLACWCRLDQPCHADVLLEIANS